MPTSVSLIVVSEWHHKGFAELLRDTWFQGQAHIVGLQWLQNHTKSSLIPTADHANVVFLDSIRHPLYHTLATLVKRFASTYVVKVEVETDPEHLTQPLHGLSIDTTVCLQHDLLQIQAFPRESNLWNKTKKWKDTNKLPLTPKPFLILADNGMGKDFHYLKQGTKYPFSPTLSHWESLVVDQITKCGIVGVACQSVHTHSMLRHFWNTYGIHVLENPQASLSLPKSALKTDFLKVLSQPKSLLWSLPHSYERIDCDSVQTQWEQVATEKTPNGFEWGNQAVSYDTVLHTQQGSCFRHDRIPDAKVVKEANSTVARLPLIDIPEESLPTVSICTVTRNHRLMFPFVVNSIRHQSYPLHKLEWVILQNGKEPIEDLIPKQLRQKLKRFHIETLPDDHGKSLAELRNIVVSHSQEPFVAFMDDDDIYFHTCLLARIKTLMKYNVDCVGSKEIGTYDLLQEKGSVASDGPRVLSEASMAFRRSFWEERGFYHKERTGEAHGFLLGRQLRCKAIPYHFNLLALTHSENTTGTLRLIEGKEIIPLTKLLTEHELTLLESTVKYLKLRYRVVKHHDR